MLFHLTNPQFEVSFIAFEEKVTKFDTTYFGYVKVFTYRSWAYFTKTQLEYIQQNLQLTSVSEGLKNYTSGVHYSKAKAQEIKHYFNVLFLLLYTKNPLTKSNYSFRKTCFAEYLSSRWKEHFSLRWYLSDRPEVIFKESVPHSLRLLQSKFHLEATYPSILARCSSFNDLALALLPKGKVSPEFFAEFKQFLIKNKLRQQYDRYEVNTKLINTCLFLRHNFSADEVTNFPAYLKLINHVFKNWRCFSYFTEGKFLPEWDYCFNLLCAKSRVKTFLKWKFYAGRIDEMTKVLKVLELRDIPFNRFDDPLYSFNFFSKRYANEKVEDNLELPNLNKKYGELLPNDISQIKLEGYNIKKVETYQELIKIGIQLHNCAGNYEKIREYKECLNFVVSKEDKVLYLGTIQRGELEQIKGFKNSAPPQELFNHLAEQLKEQSVITRFPKYKDACIQQYH